MKERASQPQFPSTQEKRQHPPPLPPQVQPLTQGQSESMENVSCPLSLKYLLRTIKPWDKHAVIKILKESATFGYAIDLLVLKDDITQVCKMEEIGATTVALYTR